MGLKVAEMDSKMCLNESGETDVQHTCNVLEKVSTIT